MCECVVGGLSVSAVNNFVFFLFTGFLLCSFWLKRFIYFEFNIFLYLVAQDILTFEFLCVAVSHFFLLGIRDIQVLVLISFQLCTCVNEFVLAYRSSLYCSLRVINP